MATRNNPPGRGFTIVELLVVVALIVVLIAFLIPALANVRKTGQQTESISRMKQIGQWMRLYSTDNREYILPSQFDYSGNQFSYKGTVRAPADKQGNPVAPALGDRHQGTWSDILWTEQGLGRFPDALAPLNHDYATDSPDEALYAVTEDFDNPLRAAAANSRNTGQTAPGDVATPFGNGAREAGNPGYFAANDFFDARPELTNLSDLGDWWTTGQIRRPDRSMYLVDSVAGETIGEADASVANPGSWDLVMNTSRQNQSDANWPCQVDFRYNGNCLMLFLDGHVEPRAPWGVFPNLLETQQVRVMQLSR
jgi:prepilin-type N-terminal cleavage/methylation domain-containing protein/prepilin-type processing-associated H-X9-DG protein